MNFVGSGIARYLTDLNASQPTVIVDDHAHAGATTDSAETPIPSLKHKRSILDRKFYHKKN